MYTVDWSTLVGIIYTWKTVLTKYSVKNQSVYEGVISRYTVDWSTVVGILFTRLTGLPLWGSIYTVDCSNYIEC